MIPRRRSRAIDRLAGADWYALFKDLHAGMILELAGNRKEAAKRLERAHKLDNTRSARGRSLWRLARPAGQQGRVAESLRGLRQGAAAASADHRGDERDQCRRAIAACWCDNAQDGAAEVLYGIGAALGRRGGEDLGLAYLQLALYLSPQHPLALLSLADLYEAMKKPQLAIKIYEQVPAASPLRRNAEIQMATNLDTARAHRRSEGAAGQTDRRLIRRTSKPSWRSGNIQRARKSYADCAETYRKGIATIGNPEKPNWLIFYFRGICHERAKQWSPAEADLKKALELFPDQPHVLNYLGYSWVDQGVNLDEGMKHDPPRGRAAAG